MKKKHFIYVCSPLRGDIERNTNRAIRYSRFVFSSGGIPMTPHVYFINANSKVKPGIVDKDLQAIMDPTELYSGCYGRASIVFYAYNANGNKGIAAGLQNLQKLEDGEPLGGISRPEDDFEAVDDDAEDILG
jgi:hypothetical protein